MKTLRYFIISFVLMVGSANLYGQSEYSDIYDIMSDTSLKQFSEIQKTGNDFFADKDKGRGSGYKQWKRWEYNMGNHLTPDGEITNFTARNMKAFQKYFGNTDGIGDKSSKNTHGSWEFVGASYYIDGAGHAGGMGRVNCIAFHPTDQYTFYAGTPAGGLWKTTNGGGTWTCLTDGMPHIGVSGIVVHPTNPDILYILSGDGDGRDTFSIGVLKTMNGGINWQYTGLIFDVDDEVNGFKLVMHPTNSNILYAALTDGILKTINGGDLWTTELSSETVCDIEFKPNDPSIMYASTTEGKFYRSIDSGENWDQIFSGIPANTSRIAIGVSDAAPDNVYLLCGPATGVGIFKGFYVSLDAGLIFLPRSNTPNILGGDIEGQDNLHQSRYDLALVVSNSNPNLLITGGINAWRSSTGGIFWSLNSHWNTNENPVAYTHADIHALEINPLNNYIYCGSDGGIFKSTNFGDTWEDLSEGLEISQFYRIAGSESDENLIIGGGQDIGVNKLDTSSYMLHIRGGDGMDCIIDYNDSLTYYCFIQDGKLYKTTNGGQWWTVKSPTESFGPWLTPLAMDHSNSNILYCGYFNVMKTTNGASSWSNMGADGSNGIAVGKNNPDRVYAMNYNTLFHSDNGGSIWISLSIPNLDPRSIVIDPVNSLHIYIVYANYFDGEKVYESWNGGEDWTNISGSLPDVPVYCIAYEEGSAGGVYIGTAIGVFYRDQNLSDWIYFGNGLPSAPVKDLDIHYSSGTIRAGTYGRGVWTSPLYSSCPSYYYLDQMNDPSNPNYTGHQYYEAAFYISSSRIITGGEGSDVTYKSNGDIYLFPGFEVTEGSEFNATIGPCTAKSQAVSDTVNLKTTETKLNNIKSY